MSRRRNYVPREVPDMDLPDTTHTDLPVHIAPVAVDECVATTLDPDGTRDAWSPLKQSHIDVKRHLEGLISGWALANPNKYSHSLEVYGVLLTFARRRTATGWDLLVTVNQNHYLKLAKS